MRIFSRFLTAACFVAASAAGIPAASHNPAMPRMPVPTRPVRLLAASSVFSLEQPVATLTPTDVTVVQRLESPAAVRVEVDRDPSRSYFFIAITGTHDWQQISSSSPYLFAGGYRVYVSSPSLPATCAAGGIDRRITFGSDFNSQSDTLASQQTVERGEDPAPSFYLDARSLAPMVEASCGLTGEAAIAAARELIRADSAWELTVRVRLRSVSRFVLENASLTIFGN